MYCNAIGVLGQESFALKVSNDARASTSHPPTWLTATTPYIFRIVENYVIEGSQTLDDLVLEVSLRDMWLNSGYSFNIYFAMASLLSTLNHCFLFPHIELSWTGLA